MRWLPAFVVLLGLASAGCLGGGGSDDPVAPDGGMSNTGSMTPVGAPAGPRLGVESPPTWTVGQSWTWRLTGSSLGEAAEGTSVVVAVGGGTYDIGAGDVAGGAALYPFHVIGFGAIDPACLCWEAHGSPVEMLRFPLADGDRFTTDFWSAPGAAVVLNATEVAGPDGLEPGFRAVATYAEGGVFLQADYAPARGQFVRVATYFGAAEPFAEAVLVGEGGGATGVGFRATELARYRASAADPASLAPHPVTVPPGSEVVMLSCFLPAAQGFYAAGLSTAGLPIGCAGGFSDQTRFAGRYTEATAGPGSVSAATGGQGTISVEVFAVDTTV